MVMLPEMLKAVIHINDNHGRGRITGIQIDQDTIGGEEQRGTVTRVPYGCRQEVRRFRFCWETKTLYFLGKQRKV